MAKNFFSGKVKIDNQVESFDMSTLEQGKLKLPVGAISKLEEIDSNLLAGDVLAPDGDKLVAEKHIKAEEAARTQAIGDVNAALNTEKTERENADNTLQGNIDAEQSRAEAAEGVLTSNLAAEVTRAQTAESANATAIDAEKARAEAAEEGLDTLIKAEETARIAAVDALDAAYKAADAVHTAAIAAEETRAQAAEAALGVRIDNVLSNTDEVALNSLAELVDAFQAADSDLAVTLQAYTASHDEEFNALSGAFQTEKGATAVERARIEAEYKAADVQFSSDLSAEQTARIAADNTLTADLAAEVTRATAAEVALQAKIDAEEVAREQADEAILGSKDGVLFSGDMQGLSDKIDFEEGERIAADEAIRGSKDGVLFSGDMQGLSDKIDFEESERIAGDLAIQNSLDAYKTSNDDALAAEVARAQAAEQVNADAISAEVTRATGEEAAIRSEFAAADTALHTTISAEIDADVLVEKNRAEAQEALIRSEFAAADVVVENNMKSYTDGEVSLEKTARENGDAALQAQINDILSNTDPAALDSLTEIVAAFQAADSNLQTSITNVLGTHTSELNAYTASNDAALAALDLEVSGNKDAIEAEETRALAAEAALSSSIDDEIAARIAGDAALQASLDAEVARASAAEGANATAISNEVARATAAEAALQAEIDGAKGEIQAMAEGKVSVEMHDGPKIGPMAEGFEYYIVNKPSEFPVGVQLPASQDMFRFSVTVASTSGVINFSAPAGLSIDGDDGQVTLQPGASVSFVRYGNTFYMM